TDDPTEGPLDAPGGTHAVLVSGPSYGTLSLLGDGSFTYTPNAGFVGMDSFMYKLDDGIGFSNVPTVFLDIGNGIPTAFGDYYLVVHGQALSPSSSVLANDTDPEGDALTPTLVSGPSHGTLSFQEDGTFTYLSDGNFAGLDSFTYSVTDGMNNSMP